MGATHQNLAEDLKPGAVSCNWQESGKDLGVACDLSQSVAGVAASSGSASSHWKAGAHQGEAIVLVSPGDASRNSKSFGLVNQ